MVFILFYFISIIIKLTDVKGDEINRLVNLTQEEVKEYRKFKKEIEKTTENKDKLIDINENELIRFYLVFRKDPPKMIEKCHIYIVI